MRFNDIEQVAHRVPTRNMKCGRASVFLPSGGDTSDEW
jgi:hypothetical protein